MPHSAAFAEGIMSAEELAAVLAGDVSGTRKRVSRDQRPPVQPSTLEPTTPQKTRTRTRNWTIPWLSTYVRHHSARV